MKYHIKDLAAVLIDIQQIQQKLFRVLNATAIACPPASHTITSAESALSDAYQDISVTIDHLQKVQ